MTEPAAAQDPSINPEIDAFWNVARFHAKLNTLPSYFGPTPLESLPPPAWGFEDDDQLASLLASGGTTLSGLREEYGDEVPESGTLGIVCDTEGRPRALVATTSVEVTDERVSEELTVVWAAPEER